MTIDYKAENRKALVQAISEFTGAKAKYLGMPSAAYQIDYFTVTKEGTFLQSEPEEVTEYSEALVRRMIEKITVYDDHFVVEFKSGIEITINE